MKDFICVLISFFLLGCENSDGEQKDNNMVKFYGRSLMENLQKSPQDERVALIYKVIGLKLRDHHQSIYRDDSEVSFKLKENTPFSKGLENVVMFYDKYSF